MRVRIISRADMYKLEAVPGTPALLPPQDDHRAAVVVVEDESGVPVACVTVISVTHFEGFWVSPAHRANPGVVRALIRQAVAIPAMRGENWVLGATALDDTIMPKILSGLGGAPLRASFSVLPIGDGSCLMRF